MATEIGICNSALSKIGVTKAISSLTEGSKTANACNEQYAKLRDDLLRAHLWNFATARAELQASTTAPASEYDFAYQLPSDWIRTVAVHDNDAGEGAVEYRIEGRQILANALRAWLKYVKRVADPNEMPADFREALALMLAAELAAPIANSNTLKTTLAAEFQRKLRKAKSTDAVEDYPESMPAGSWVTARN